MLRRLLGLNRNENDEIVARLYGEIVAAARQPVIYARWDVPDTPLGRFEVMALHLILLLERLDGKGERALAVAQRLTDDFFTDLDHSLRELGISDPGVPKRMKKLAKMFYGRAASYSQALRAGDVESLAAALARNVRPEASQWSGAHALASYALDAYRHLSVRPLDLILADGIDLPSAEASR
ncbi:MAG: ubiquinol-cytochrome C chaperone [Rhizobiaceae bacterium]|nr:ubiquinol-cytochrome C chaperone [Rhizobiaceae bacterium]MCV0405298.1 ubiquinol-cytochrome C chaperone [Rhizobiaceae bacterium]